MIKKMNPRSKKPTKYIPLVGKDQKLADDDEYRWSENTLWLKTGCIGMTLFAFCGDDQVFEKIVFRRPVYKLKIG